MNNESVEIVELRKKIEESVGRVMHTPADFDFLSGAVWERIREYISPTTLKRTWGYLDGVKNIRFSTLETLARFAGFKSWDNYLAERRFAQEQNSAFVSTGVIEAARLAEGDVGDTAAVMLFVPGEPLLLSELSHRGKTGLTYLCGGKGGLIHLNFAILVDENADRASKLRQLAVCNLNKLNFKLRLSNQGLI